VSDADGGTLTLLRASAPGVWAHAWTVPAAPVARGIAAADLDRDGRLDLAVASAKSTHVAVLLADAAGGVRTTLQEAGTAPFAVAAADLDGDGFVDLAVANETNAGERRGDVTVLYGDGTGGFPRRLTLAAGTYPADVEIADLDGDGRRDLAVLSWGSGDVSVFHALADGGFAPASSVPHGGGPAYGLAAGDLDQDGTTDLAVADAAGLVHVLCNRGAGVLVPADVLTVGAGARDVAAADLDADGRLDLATADTAAGSVSILRGLGGGRFAPRQVVAVGSRPRRLTAADLDLDGRLDLAVTDGGDGRVSVLLARSPTS